NLTRLQAWTEAGAVQRLTLLASKFFVEHYGELWQQCHEVLGAPHRLAAARTHCKVVCFDFATGDKMALEGSANLRTNSNWEQYALCHGAGLDGWHSDWIDREVSRHENAR